MTDEWWPWDNTDTLCVLRSPGHRATKIFTKMPDGSVDKKDYDNGYLHQYSISPAIADLNGLAAILKRLEVLPEHFVVRGEPQRPAPIEREFRRGGSFACVDRRWLMVDVDKCPGDSVADAIARLPDYFQGVACWYHYSASAGLKPGVISVHLWYWLARAVCCHSLRDWAKALGGVVDVNMYQPVQPHYTANPIFNGLDNPIAERSGMWPGRPSLSLPDSVVDLATWEVAAAARAAEAEKIRRQAAALAAYNPRAGHARTAYAERALSNAVERILGAGVGDRHRVIFQQSASIASLCRYLDLSAAQSALESAALAAYAGEGRDRDALKTVADGIATGRTNERDLSHIGDPLGQQYEDYLDWSALPTA
jgi:hypothetical protein